MSLLQFGSNKRNGHATMVRTSNELTAIHRPDCPAVIWERRQDTGLQLWLKALAPKNLPRVRGITPRTHAHEVIAYAIENSGAPNCAERRALIDDASNLANVFSDVLDTRYLRLRFDVVTGNVCRKFHIDAVTARFVCTYRGTGTQYGLAGELEEPVDVFTVPTCTPILMRGTLWPVVADKGFRHRSPPI